MRSRFLRRTKLLHASLLCALGTLACGGRTELGELDDDAWSSGGGGPALTGGTSSGGGTPSSGGSGAGPNGGADSGGTSAGGNSSGGTVGSGEQPSGGAGGEDACILFGAEMELLDVGAIDVAFALAHTETELLVAGHYWSGDPDARNYHSALARLGPGDQLQDDPRANFAVSDEPRGIAVHPSGSVFLAGIANEPGEDPSSRSLVARWNAEGSVWATYEGSGRNEQATAVASGPSGATYVVGFSYGSLGPADRPQAFLRRYLDVDSGGPTLEFDVSDIARLNAVYVSKSGDVYVAGSSLVRGRPQAHLRVLQGSTVDDRIFDENTEEATALLVANDGTIHLAGSGRHGAFAKGITPDGHELFTTWMNVFGLGSVTRGLARDARGAVWWVGGTPEKDHSFLTTLAEDGHRPWTTLFDGATHAIIGDDACNLYLAGDFPSGNARGALLKVQGRSKEGRP